MLNLHEKRYEYTHDKDLIINNLTDFSIADEDFYIEIVNSIKIVTHKKQISHPLYCYYFVNPI